jgi:large conductance mechanosensitive channel
MRNLLQEFKAFAFKGNMIDLAVGIVIGAAFTTIVNSLVKNIIMPSIALITPTPNYSEWKFRDIQYGVFVGDVVNFLIVSAAVFIVVVKLIGFLVKRGDAAKPAPPPVKECPQCLSEIPVKALRCKFCTSELPAAER